jgi:hypothetical protein
LDDASLITAWNLSMINCTRGRAMVGQDSAEPMIGPTRVARSRTTLRVSLGAALALFASRIPLRMMAERGLKHERCAKVRSNH